MTRNNLRLLASTSLVLLIFLCILWESVWAPMRPGGSMLMLKTLPLLVPLFGVLHGRVYTYQWASLLSLGYFCEGVVRAWSDSGLSQKLALAEVALSVVLFASLIFYVHTWRSARA
ncbi:MAG: DUF2069 domain-containing protein [Betaproteobacteria bacterium]